MTTKKRLNIWMPPDLYDAVMRDANRERRKPSQIFEDLLRAGLGMKHTTAMERQAIPALRELVSEENAAAFEQLRRVIRDDIRHEIGEENRQLGHRLAGLVVRACREAGIGHRLTYALLARLVDPKSAQIALADAQLKAGADLKRPLAEVMKEEASA